MKLLSAWDPTTRQTHRTEGSLAKDGYFILAAGNNALWSSVCEMTGAQDAHWDSRFQTTADRAINQVQLKELLEKKFKTYRVVHWLEVFPDAGVPCSPTNLFSNTLGNAQNV